jgi:hypothetical protein
MNESSLLLSLALIFFLAGGYNAYKQINHIIERRKEKKSRHPDTYVQLFLGSVGALIGIVGMFVQFGWLLNFSDTDGVVIGDCSSHDESSVLIQYYHNDILRTSCQNIEDGMETPLENTIYPIKVNGNIPSLINVNW